MHRKILQYSCACKFQCDEDVFDNKKLGQSLIHVLVLIFYLMMVIYTVVNIIVMYYIQHYMVQIHYYKEIVLVILPIKYEETGVTNFYQDNDEKPIKLVAGGGYFCVLTNKNRLYSQGLSHWDSNANNGGDRTRSNKGPRVVSNLTLSRNLHKLLVQMNGDSWYRCSLKRVKILFN